MRLVRIEAGRFGKIDGRALGELSPGLTVVHGPNEAGKSSLMALVRHVLYGFPTRGAVSEAPYLSDAGAREGRLVFADDDGEWIVERKEGAHGGPVTVRTLSGRPRDGLTAELTAGVSRLAYRVVFGFGLAEMQQIEELKGKDDDLIARLYAAGAGLTVSPIDVRARLEAAMGSLWAKRASTAELNQAKARRDELRGRIRALEAETDTLRGDASRLERLEKDTAATKLRRTEAQVRAERVSRAVSDAARLTEQSMALAREAERLGLAAAAARDEAGAHQVDEEAVAVAATVDALAAELSGFRETIASVSADESRLASVEARLRGALDETGWSEASALAAAADAGVASEIDVYREALDKARGRAEAAVAARDRLRADASVEPVPAVGTTGPWRVPAAVTAVLGGGGLVVGLLLTQWALAAFAAVLLVAGIVMLFAVRAPGPAAGGASSSSRLAAAETECTSAESALAARVAAWSAWVAARGLGDGSEDPRAIAARYQAARTVRAAEGERSLLREACARERDRADAYARRVFATAAPLVGERDAAVTPDRVPEMMNRAVARLADVRATAARNSEAQTRAEGLARDASAALEHSRVALRDATAALETIGAVEGGLETARALETEARTLAKDASDEFDRLSAETTALRTALGSERREGALSELRLEEETVGERIADGVQEYAVLAVAAKLLSLAQERYERDRQPEVVKRAEAAFAAMTNGRYARLAVPLGKDAIEVFDASSAATSPGRLSRGTAEQLYLALRLGLIEQLGDAGKGLPVLMDDILVDFSPDRLEPAARAIADLATRRQVVFLTCHPATADLLCRISPQAVRLELDGPAPGVPGRG